MMICMEGKAEPLICLSLWVSHLNLSKRALSGTGT